MKKDIKSMSDEEIKATLWDLQTSGQLLATELQRRQSTGFSIKKEKKEEKKDG
jgi:hypothetical protein